MSFNNYLKYFGFKWNELMGDGYLRETRSDSAAEVPSLNGITQMSVFVQLIVYAWSPLQWSQLTIISQLMQTGHMD